ncbi:MAG: RNA-binding S4 domain-containing protein [Bacteroidota bacterium]|nr:RNA-binding S4 domain-containing protein [Bacteroidota bacterium]
MESQVRVDKYLWSVRIYKTRSIAAEACKKGKVSLNGVSAKSSKIVNTGDLLTIYKAPVQFQYKVLMLSGKRLMARLVPNYLEDITPMEEKEKLRKPKYPDFGIREKGLGRPTKKERRIMDQYQREK